jgi:7-carboxy-7-deazaguanine synthase
VQRHDAARWAPQVVRRLVDAYRSWQLKFVVRWREPESLRADLEEIDTWLEALGVDRVCDREHVQLMPECIDPSELPKAYAAIMPACIERGFRLGERLHIHIFGHQPGT